MNQSKIELAKGLPKYTHLPLSSNCVTPHPHQMCDDAIYIIFKFFNSFNKRVDTIWGVLWVGWVCIVCACVWNWITSVWASKRALLASRAQGIVSLCSDEFCIWEFWHTSCMWHGSSFAHEWDGFWAWLVCELQLVTVFIEFNRIKLMTLDECFARCSFKFFTVLQN